MRIQHNIMAMSAYRNYTNNVSAMKKNLEKLSSGYKINRAGDDAAGLAISEKMRAQITGLETAQKNAKDGISLVQTAEGALTEVHDMLNRMVELATQSANGTYDDTTDRAQMQKEINQLLEEIDRIADSSNFNGINLLDGTLGLNTDAFEVLGTVDGADAVAGNPLSNAFALATANAGASQAHYSGSVSQQNPSFTISMGSLAAKVTGTNTGNKVTVQVSIAGVATKTATLANAGGTATTEGTWTTASIAAAVASAFATTAIGGTNYAVINGYAFTVEAGNNGDINFTFAGVASTNGGNTTIATTTIGTTDANNFNTIFGGAVTTTIATTGNGETTGMVDHDILNAKEAVAGGTAQRAGIDITLQASLVANGNILTIDGQKFEFKTTASYTQQDTSATLIDVSGKATSAQLREAVLQLSNKTAGNFEIQTKNPGGGIIHIEQTVESFKNGASSGTKYTYDDLVGLVSATGAGTPATANGTQLKVTASAIKDGNTITVVDGSVTTKYIFGKGTDVATGANQVKYIASKSAAALASAIGSKASLSNGVITIRAANAAASAAAPTVLGKGLTLQIGDTAADYNQLNVTVQDCHSASLGIGNLSIATEEDAQAAIDKIKAAVNYVSDVRGTLGATQNRLDHTINNLSVMTENIQDAESTIRDVDVAEEMMAYTKNNILIQSAQAMLAQANQVPQGVLQLLQ